MKKHILYISAILLLASSCKQDVITLEQPTPASTTTPSKGSLDFTKYVAVGNSLTSGYQAGALFTEGQQNSFPLILSKQFSLAQGVTLAFNQPDINSVNGYNSTYSDPAHGIFLGRLVLFASDGISADAVPTPSGYPGVPAPYNTADFPSPYTGDKTKLNNFGVPLILLGQVLTPATGGPYDPLHPTANPAYNIYYARFASHPSVDGTTGSSIISDAIAAQPTFFTFDLGNNDILGYATTGGDGSIPLTTTGDFQTYYATAIGALLNPATNPNNPKGVVSTIPDVTTIPFFFTVKWNAIPLDQATATAVNAGFAGYNQILDEITSNPTLLAGFGLSASELSSRKISFNASANNSILINDETLVDLGSVFDYLAANSLITSDQRTALIPYEQVRQTTSSDLVILTAGGILGTLVNSNPTLVNGVTVPLADKYILLPSEITEIQTATTAFNGIITAVANTYSSNIAIADVNAVFKSLITSTFVISDNVTIMPSFTPPFGAFSEDGIHPNSRGYAYLANIFIDAINTKFGPATYVPKASLSDYKGVGLPLVP